MSDPYAGLDAEEEALDAASAAYFEAASSVPVGKVEAAVKTGSVNPVVSSLQWRRSGAGLLAAVTRIELRLVRTGLKQGLAEIPGTAPAPALSARIGQLAEEHAGKRAVELAQAIDEKTRAGLRTLIGRASREYAADQSLSTLRRLVREVRSSIGLTPKQAAKVLRWRSAAQALGLQPETIAAGVAQRSEAAIALRARAIADRGVVESISFARHQSWVEAVAVGDLPVNVKKRWVTQGDSRVRPRHRAQAAAGPIPLKAIFHIMNVMYPPSHEQGCRCFANLVIPQ